jgi:hypothetical protein
VCNTTAQFELVAPTTSTNRQCKALTACPEQFFRTLRESTATSDRLCISLLEAATFVNFSVLAAEARVESLRNAVEDLVDADGKGALYTAMQRTDAGGSDASAVLVYQNVTLGFLDPPPARDDNPAPGTAFLYFGLRFVPLTELDYERQVSRVRPLAWQHGKVV